MNMKLWAGVGFTLTGFAAASTVLAHHSYAQFDRCTDLTIEGSVEHIEWVNPHIVLTVDARDGTTYRVEWFNLQQLTRARLAPEVLAAGDHIEVTGARHRDPQINLLTLLTKVHRPSDDWGWSRERDRPENCAG